MAAAEDKVRLTLVGQGLSELHSSYADSHGDCARELDLNFNNFRQVKNLEHFRALQTLILDNNEIDSHTTFPVMSSVHTLWVNNNNIADLDVFIQTLKKSFPNLMYLSMLKNPACPELIAEDHKRYRSYVLKNIPRLKFLDSSKVTPQELEEARRSMIQTEERSSSEESRRNSATTRAHISFRQNVVLFPNARLTAKKQVPSMRGGSEGNRFITNSQL